MDQNEIIPIMVSVNPQYKVSRKHKIISEMKHVGTVRAKNERITKLSLGEQ
jgi:hypothetical protein